MRFAPLSPRTVRRPLALRCWVSVLVAIGLASSATDASAQAGDSQQPPAGSGAVPSGGSGAAVVPGQQPAPSPGKPNVQPPQLKQFVPAAYPPAAKDQALEGNVVLQLDIDASGRVTAVTVVNPAGHGFDEAAADAARQFVFEPALRDGKPIPARILYRYSFSLEASKPGQTSQETGQPVTGPIKNLTGVVRTSTGEVPIVGATVTVRDTTGAERVATTSEDGSWSFVDLPPGKYTVRVQSPGYQPLQVEEQVAGDEVTEVVYRIVAEGALEVVIRGKRPPREVTKRTLEKREIERVPGTAGDALRSIENMPGVARPPPFAGILIVRGSAPEDTEVLIDGTSVPLVYHFGGLSSVVPTELLSKIDFYPGNFSAGYGRVMGGIVDVGLRSPKNDGRYHGMGQVDLIDVRALLEGPVPYARGWTFAAGVRRSWFDTWLKPVLEAAGSSVTAAPVYYDWQVYTETQPTARSRFRIGVYGSDDRLELLSKDTAEVDPVLTGNLRFRTGFYRVFATYENDFTDDLSLYSTTAYGTNRIDVGLGQLYFNLKVHPLTNRTELSYRFNKGATAHLGVDMLWGTTDVRVVAPPIPQDGEPSPGPFATRPPLTAESTDDVYRPAAYLELELTPYRRFKLVPGLRVDYAKDIERWDVSPRVNGRYVLVEGFPQTTMKGGLGIYQRPPEFQETFPPFGTKGLRSNRSIHYSLGVEQDITRKIDISVEGFYKKLDLLVARGPDASGGYTYNNLGSGYVVGSEMLLRYKPDDRFFGWIAYTLSRSMRREAPDQELHFTTYDQTHVLTALGSYRLGRGWEFGARYRVVSGNPYTPVVGSVYDANAGAYAPIDAAKQFSARFPLFTQLDVRVDKTWKYEDWKLSTYLDIQNVYYAQNVQDYQYNYNYTQKSPVSGLPIIPSIGVRGEF
jgi:TonB family protein